MARTASRTGAVGKLRQVLFADFPARFHTSQVSTNAEIDQGLIAWRLQIGIGPAPKLGSARQDLPSLRHFRRRVASATLWIVHSTLVGTDRAAAYCGLTFACTLIWGS